MNWDAKRKNIQRHIRSKFDDPLVCHPWQKRVVPTDNQTRVLFLFCTDMGEVEDFWFYLLRTGRRLTVSTLINHIDGIRR